MIEKKHKNTAIRERLGFCFGEIIKMSIQITNEN